MVVFESGYYDKPVKGFNRVNQRYPLYTKIFSIIADAVNRHFMMIMEGFACSVQHVASFFVQTME